nr:MAG TPA: hypothetical protein [Caudoviricetes sp.]
MVVSRNKGKAVSLPLTWRVGRVRLNAPVC